jgi:MFS superfamily sulfate permease-like transporter
MNNKWLGKSLFLTTLLSGFYGGIGFFTAIGGNPAISKLSARSFAEYWQSIDSFMGARMPVFGPLLMLSVLLSAVLLFQNRFKNSAAYMLLAFLVLAGDVAFALTTNHPYNQLIQSWDLNHLPSNVEEIKWQVVQAFNVRMLFMIASFALVLFSVWTKNYKAYQNLIWAAGGRLSN